MYYLVNVDHNSVRVNSTRCHSEGFSDVLYIQYSEWGLIMIYTGMTMKRMGMLGVSVRKMKALDCEDGDNDTDF